MRNPTPAPIVIPVTGTPTCRGIYLGTHDLSEWRNDDRDAGLDADMVVKAHADRATRDGSDPGAMQWSHQLDQASCLRRRVPGHRFIRLEHGGQIGVASWRGGQTPPDPVLCD